MVRSDVGHTFDTFVRTIGVWWPVTPFSAGQDRVRDVTFERRLGGRVYETWDDGTQVDWGTLRAWEPPERFVMSWNITSVRTEVELRFTALGPALTRVAVSPGLVHGLPRTWAAAYDRPLRRPGTENAMAVFTTREAAEEFAKGDPFVHHGVVRKWTIREWNEALVP